MRFLFYSFNKAIQFLDRDLVFPDGIVRGLNLHRPESNDAISVNNANLLAFNCPLQAMPQMSKNMINVRVRSLSQTSVFHHAQYV